LCQEDFSVEELHIEKILEEKELRIKAYAPRKANEPCHRSA
jgi:hypothetical protein